jgi:hypothetical protein
VFERLASRDPAVASPALEYLGHVLPRRVFRSVVRIFEQDAKTAAEDAADAGRLAEWIRFAWETGDAWLRACAVRASRHSPAFDRALFATGDGGDPIVRAELDALASDDRAKTEPRTC